MKWKSLGENIFSHLHLKKLLFTDFQWNDFPSPEWLTKGETAEMFVI